MSAGYRIAFYADLLMIQAWGSSAPKPLLLWFTFALLAQSIAEAMVVATCGNWTGYTT